MKKIIKKIPYYRKIMRAKRNRELNRKLKILDASARTSKIVGINKKEDRDQLIIVSLTTYGYRIKQVHYVIENLMSQSIKADKIILWLSEEEFSYENIPDILKLQELRGLTIEFCPDYKSYKKIIPALNKFPDDLILTVDDDIVFPASHIEKLYAGYHKTPNVIHCHRAHKMAFDENGSIKPYKRWYWETLERNADITIFPTGGAGALYFPKCFHPDVTNVDLFMSLCPHADDVWLKFMSLRNGVKCQVVEKNHRLNKEMLEIRDVQTGGLWSINDNGNDKQIKNIIMNFDDLKFEKIGIY